MRGTKWRQPDARMGKVALGNAAGTRAWRRVEDRYRSRNKMVILAME